ncbi:PspC domain-containing protein [Streptomyces sp. NPDC018031]|uniref:PspC domain-containing protein n=1 Tax=Streptomyces sp. NPDC018031 TaxID=3365033 RepID=UPI0037B6DAD4
MTDAHPVADAHRRDGSSSAAPPGSGPQGPGPSGPPGAPGDGPDPQGPAPGPVPLRRSPGNKVFGGVCGGLGRYCDVDPVIFRVVFSVLAVTGGIGLIVYGFCWLLVPMLGEDEHEGRRLLSGRVEGTALTALLCALVGCGLFLSMLNKGNIVGFSVMLSLATVGAAYWSRHRHQADGETGDTDTAAPQTAAGGTAAGKGGHEGAPPETQAPPARGGPSWWRDPIVKDGTTGHVGTGYLWGPADGPDAGGYATGRAAAAARSRPAPERTSIGGWTFLAAVAAAAIGIGATWATQPLGTSLQTGFVAALAVFGAGLLISSVYGRTGAGTMVAVVLTSGLLAGAAALPKSVTADWKRRTWTPATADAVARNYELGTGVGRLELARLPLTDGRRVRTEVDVGAGRLVVTVPRDARVELDIEVGLGDVQLPGENSGDIDVSPLRDRRVTLEPMGGGPARGTLELDLEVGIGQVEVLRP